MPTIDLRLGDCLEVMRTMPDKSVDAVITDPPYGIGITKSHRLATSRGMGGKTWDNAPIEKHYIDEMFRVSKTLVIWGGNYFDLPPTRCVLVWDKRNDGRDFADLEMAWTNLDSVARIFRKRPMNMDGGKVHPTQKPIDLMKWCIGKVKLSRGSTILDPFMGSGSTAIACHEMGMNFIGVEIDPTYYAIAERRIREAQQQPTLLEAA